LVSSAKSTDESDDEDPAEAFVRRRKLRAALKRQQGMKVSADAKEQLGTEKPL